MEGVEMFLGLLISHDLLKLPAEESKHLLEPFQAGLPKDEESLRLKFKESMKDLELYNKRKPRPSPTGPGSSIGSNG